MNCIIIDDEILARKYIKDYVSKIPFLNLIGDYNSPMKAIDQIENGKVDLLFLDIQMPNITGIDFLKRLKIQQKVILTTAYSDYAIEGYELDVIDYLLKPISFDRFLQAVYKAKAQSTKPINIETPISSVTKEDDFLLIKADRKYYKVNFDELLYIEGQKAYVSFHCVDGKRITALYSLKDLENELPKNSFLRIHKSFIVSTTKIKTFQAHEVEIEGKKLPVGKNYKNIIFNFFNTNE